MRVTTICCTVAATWLLCATAIADDSVSSGKAYPPEEPLFSRHVVPLFSRLGCNSGNCHGKVKGENGFRLSLFGVEAAEDHRWLRQEFAGRRINLLDIDCSLLLLKPTGGVAHRGGRIIEPDSAEYLLLRRWLQQGARLDSVEDSKVVALNVTPSEQQIAKGESFQLHVTAKFSDGSSEDVTPLCHYEVLDKEVAAIDRSGTISALGVGDAAIVVRYGSEPVVVSVIVPGAPIDFPQVKIHNFIDSHVLAKLKMMSLPPAELCDDATFLRRVSLDITGTLPSPDQARKFLADGDANKRSTKIEELLACPDYSRLWALKFCDILRPNPYNGNVFLARAEEQRFYRWLRQRIDADTPYTELARQIITATSDEGRSHEEWLKEAIALAQEDAKESPELSVYGKRQTLDLYWNREQAVGVRGTIQVAHAFLGLRLECAQCHRHPHDVWRQDDLLSFATFFNQLKGYGEYQLSKEDAELQKRWTEQEAKEFEKMAQESEQRQREAENKVRERQQQLGEIQRQVDDLERRARERSEEEQRLRDDVKRIEGELAAAGNDENRAKEFKRQIEERTRQADDKRQEAEKFQQDVDKKRSGELKAKMDEVAQGKTEFEKLRDQTRHLRWETNWRRLAAKRINGAKVFPLIGERFRQNTVYVENALGRQESNTFRLLGESEPLVIDKQTDPRTLVADWMTRADNPFFAKAIVNRVWAHYMGRGIVDPPDNLSPLNPASHPALLDELAAKFVDNGYSLRWLHRTIVSSRTYQQSSALSKANQHDRSNYASYYVKRLPAEVLIDALNQATGWQEEIPSSLFLPPDARVIEIAGEARGSEGGPRAQVEYALELFGRPERNPEVVCDCERESSPTVAQTLYLANHPLIRRKIYAEDGAVAKIVADLEVPERRVEEIYLRTVGHEPTTEQLKSCIEYITQREGSLRAYQDVLWSLINTREFSLNY